MRERLRLFGYFAIFWLSFQVVIRIVFLLYNHALSSDLTTSEIMLVFAHGLKMDASMTGYFLALTGLMLSASVFTGSKWLFGTFNVLMIFMLILSSIIVMVDIELYRHWGFRMNTTPLFYVGSEAIGSVETLVVIKLLTIGVALFSLSTIIYRNFLAKRLLQLRVAESKTVVPVLILTGLMFIPIRGSFTVAPMNTGFVYFHKTKPFANHSAINVVWNFLYSVKKGANVEYSENFFDKQKSQNIFNDLHSEADSTTALFNTPRPNIILFILESFTADVIEPLGGVKGVTPNINRYCSEGILFDNFYSSGDRTDKGLISILSGYPAQPTTSIIKSPSKTQRLPYLNRHVRSLGYKTSFVYGGDIDFANFRSYLTGCLFDNTTTEDDFPDSTNVSKWGVHDHYVLERAFAETDTTTTPFFKVILTLSSHEPFDVPAISEFSGKTEASMFLNSCHYTDKSIGTFIEKAKQTDWWKNTVVVFVADHGHRLPNNHDMKDKEKFRIPFLMIGGAIRQDTVIHTLGSHTDIANTLLAQIGKPSKEFKFSKNLMASDVKPFAAYFFNDGFGFITPSAYVVHDNIGKQFIRSSGATQQVLDAGKAYQQVLYSDYNKK
jgi:phosphoglycerol transferase MdoB-like AlkP superfamily enzyme